ncbi:MAG TPA: hypothetical protein VHR97_03790 [Candidatus Baltobacteraceae bacterium]|jgi:hypothetical protein|nr:hypothetical protein [Candidatus Baltobacteraceae bacterium]
MTILFESPPDDSGGFPDKSSSRWLDVADDAFMMNELACDAVTPARLDALVTPARLDAHLGFI